MILPFQQLAGQVATLVMLFSEVNSPVTYYGTLIMVDIITEAFNYSNADLLF